MICFFARTTIVEVKLGKCGLSCHLASSGHLDPLKDNTKKRLVKLDNFTVDLWSALLRWPADNGSFFSDTSFRS